MQGEVSGSYQEHLLEFNPVPDELYGADGTTVTAAHFRFVDVEKGATISISITEELRKRLGLDSLEIKIKRR